MQIHPIISLAWNTESFPKLSFKQLSHLITWELARGSLPDTLGMVDELRIKNALLELLKRGEKDIGARILERMKCYYTKGDPKEEAFQVTGKFSQKELDVAFVKAKTKLSEIMRAYMYEFEQFLQRG